jgi:hypothetical protein
VRRPLAAVLARRCRITQWAVTAHAWRGKMGPSAAEPSPSGNFQKKISKKIWGGCERRGIKIREDPPYLRPPTGRTAPLQKMVHMCTIWRGRLPGKHQRAEAGVTARSP